MTDAKHEAPAETVTISRAEYDALKSGYPGDPSLLPEAPAEGAGELWPVGSWLSAALDDPKVCDAMKADIREWFDNGGHLRARSSAPEAREGEAVAVTIFCPQCALPHVDEGEWATTRQHKTHQCQGCGHEWRPFPFATVGVTHPAAPSADKLRSIIYAATDAVLPPACDTTGNGTQTRAATQVEIADGVIAALKAEG